LTETATSIVNAPGRFAFAQQRAQFSLHVPLTQEHETEQPVEELPEKDVIPDDVAKNLFDWIVFHVGITC
jgi:hypothetical protein